MPVDATAYDMVLRAIPLIGRMERSQYIMAGEYLSRAIEQIDLTLQTVIGGRQAPQNADIATPERYALLAAWAVLLAAWGITHAEFPGSRGRARLVMLTSLLLVAPDAY